MSFLQMKGKPIQVKFNLLRIGPYLRLKEMSEVFLDCVAITDDL